MSDCARLVVATGNAHKIDEVRAVLSSAMPTNLVDRIASLGDYPDAVEPVEDGVTFSENALIKARAACELSGLPALADDSGIVVDVLGNSPGVFSARWCGEHGNDERNRNLLLAQLADVPDAHRGAAFVCAIAIVWPDGRELTTQGQVDGTLIREAVGTGGFGYDPLFVPKGYDLTTAQMSADLKNSLSHRGKALRQICTEIRAILEG